MANHSTDIESAERRVAEAKQAVAAAQAEQYRIWRETPYRGGPDDIAAQNALRTAKKALWAAQEEVELARMNQEERADLATDLTTHDRLVGEFDRSDSDL